MNKPIISVVIPVYNSERFLDQCIRSVVEQTFAQWEIIAVDDGSTDASFQVLQRWSINDVRVKCFHKLNEGVVAAREYALHKVQGEFLFFLDSDDYLPPNSLRTLYTTMQKENADLCVGGYTLIWPQTGKTKPVCHRKRFSDAKGCMRYCLKHGEMFLPIKLYRTSLFKEVVHIPHGVILQEDTIGVSQYLEYARKVTYTSSSIYYYVKHDGSATRQCSLRHVESLIKVVDFLLHCKMHDTLLTWHIDIYCAKIIRSCISYMKTNGIDATQATALNKKIKSVAKVTAEIEIFIGRTVTDIKKIVKNRLK